MPRYPDKFKIDVLAYGDQNGDENAALQFGVSTSNINIWRAKLFKTKDINSSEGTLTNLAIVRANRWKGEARLKARKAHVKTHERKRISNQFDKQLAVWVSKRLENGRRPTLQQIGLKGLEIAPRLGKTLFIPSLPWTRRFLRRVNLEKIWQNSLRKKQKIQSAVKIEKHAKESNAKDKLTLLLLEWISMTLSSGIQTRLTEISRKGLEIEKSVGAKQHVHCSSWAAAFLKRVHLFERWRDLNPKVTITKTLKHTKSTKELDKELADWVTKRLSSDCGPTLMEIFKKRQEMAKRHGIDANPKKFYSNWSVQFLIRHGLKTKWNETRYRAKNPPTSITNDSRNHVSKFGKVDREILEEALEYAELHGNQIAANKYKIPERTFYEYVMSSEVTKKTPSLIGDSDCYERKTEMNQ